MFARRKRQREQLLELLSDGEPWTGHDIMEALNPKWKFFGWSLSTIYTRLDELEREKQVSWAWITGRNGESRRRLVWFKREKKS